MRMAGELWALVSATQDEEPSMPLSSADGQGFRACHPAAPGPRSHPFPAGEGGEGNAGPGDSAGLARLASLLRDAARAAAGSWDGLTDQQDHAVAVRALAMALGDLRTVSARLAACSRLHAMTEPAPAAFARAAGVHAAAQFLAQGHLILSDTGMLPGEPGHDRSPGDALCQAARRAAAWSQPAMSAGEEVLDPLAEAVRALAGGARALAGTAAEPLSVVLTAVGSCAGAAALQLSGHQQPSAGEPSPAPRRQRRDPRDATARSRTGQG
jgi:hypothetical protein